MPLRKLHGVAASTSRGHAASASNGGAPGYGKTRAQRRRWSAWSAGPTNPTDAARALEREGLSGLQKVGVDLC